LSEDLAVKFIIGFGFTAEAGSFDGPIGSVACLSGEGPSCQQRYDQSTLRSCASVTGRRIVLGTCERDGS
jgi:hypothetical protein